MKNVTVVENGVQAKEKIDQLTIEGFTKDNIYILAHEDKRTEHLTDKLDVNEVGVKEEGIFEKIANVFRSQGDALRSQFENLGLTEAEANQYEEELDKGRLVVIAKN